MGLIWGDEADSQGASFGEVKLILKGPHLGSLYLSTFHMYTHF